MKIRAIAGFTLIELMAVVAIIAILAAIIVPKFATLIRKGQDGSTKGRLGALRSAISIYAGDNSVFPTDDLTCLTQNSGKYLNSIPTCNTAAHPNSTAPIVETTPSDTGQWSYDNVQTDGMWGRVLVGYTHTDTKGSLWTMY